MIHEFGDGGVSLMIAVGTVSLFKKERMGGNSGFVNFVTIMGAFIGSLAFGPLGYAFGYAVPHVVSGVLQIIATVLMLFLIKEFN
jgi:hypothetical protein